MEKIDEGPVSIREIAKENAIPKRFLEHIMLDLKEKGWVKSMPGRYGGYTLGKHPSEISIGAVVRHFDGVLAPIGCVSVMDYHECSQQSKCKFRRVLLDVRNFIADHMDLATMDKIGQKIPVVRAEVFTAGFTEGGGI